MNLEKLNKKQLISMVRCMMVSEIPVCAAHNAADEIRKRIVNWRQECVVCVYLDNANKIIGAETITMGILNQSLVHPREVFAPAIEKRAASIVLGHNHPANSLYPSGADRSITVTIQESGKILGIPLLDHVIVTADGRHYSFKEHGEL